jgi:hypothetical protein
VHRRPPVGPVADVAGDAALAGDPDQGRDEAVVTLAVHGGREPQAHRPHATVGVGQGQLLGATARRVRPDHRGRVPLGEHLSRLEQHDAGGEQERAVRTLQRLDEVSTAARSVRLAP